MQIGLILSLRTMARKAISTTPIDFQQSRATYHDVLPFILTCFILTELNLPQFRS
jgi:hypothetical protein